MGLTYLERHKCGSIIHLASGAAALVGSGMAQIPMSDAILIAPIQIKMLTALGVVFNIKLSESAAKGLFASLAASCVGRSASQLMVGWIPVLGNIINAGTAAGLTEAVGWLAVEHFQSQRSKESLVGTFRRCFTPESDFKKNWRDYRKKAEQIFNECVEGLERQFER